MTLPTPRLAFGSNIWMWMTCRTCLWRVKFTFTMAKDSKRKRRCRWATSYVTRYLRWSLTMTRSIQKTCLKSSKLKRTKAVGRVIIIKKPRSRRMIMNRSQQIMTLQRLPSKTRRDKILSSKPRKNRLNLRNSLWSHHKSIWGRTSERLTWNSTWKESQTQGWTARGIQTLAPMSSWPPGSRTTQRESEAHKSLCPSILPGSARVAWNPSHPCNSWTRRRKQSTNVARPPKWSLSTVKTYTVTKWMRPTKCTATRKWIRVGTQPATTPVWCVSRRGSSVERRSLCQFSANRLTIMTLNNAL